MKLIAESEAEYNEIKEFLNVIDKSAEDIEVSFFARDLENNMQLDVGGWINIDNKQPEDKQSCLVWNYDIIEIMHYYKEQQRFVLQEDMDVTYWQPLPKPPKEK
jgi:hypothetical protein